MINQWMEWGTLGYHIFRQTQMSAMVNMREDRPRFCIRIEAHISCRSMKSFDQITCINC